MIGKASPNHHRGSECASALRLCLLFLENRFGEARQRRLDDDDDQQDDAAAKCACMLQIVVVVVVVVGSSEAPESCDSYRVLCRPVSFLSV